MKQHRIISHSDLRNELVVVARGEKFAPDWAGTQTFDSVDALRLTLGNRELLPLIRDRKLQ